MQAVSFWKPFHMACISKLVYSIHCRVARS